MSKKISKHRRAELTAIIAAYVTDKQKDAAIVKDEDELAIDYYDQVKHITDLIDSLIGITYLPNQFFRQVNEAMLQYNTYLNDQGFGEMSPDFLSGFMKLTEALRLITTGQIDLIDMFSYYEGMKFDCGDMIAERQAELENDKLSLLRD